MTKSNSLDEEVDETAQSQQKKLQENVETAQILRLAAAALLSSVVPAAVVSAFSDEHSAAPGQGNGAASTKLLATLKRVKTFCNHVSQFRNQETSLFEAEIREHGRIAEKNLRASLPEEWNLLVFFEEQKQKEE